MLQPNIVVVGLLALLCACSSEGAGHGGRAAPPHPVDMGRSTPTVAFVSPEGWHALDGEPFLPHTYSIEFVQSNSGELIVVSASRASPAPGDARFAHLAALRDEFASEASLLPSVTVRGWTWTAMDIPGSGRAFMSTRKGILVSVFCQGEWNAVMERACIGVMSTARLDASP